MIDRQLLTCFFLFTLISLNAKALPPPSPAGGNYLVLDGKDDYAVLDFEKFGVLLPQGTDEFTVEAWVYPTKPPNRNNITAVVLSQQARIRIVGDNHRSYQSLKKRIDWRKGDLLVVVDVHMARRGGTASTPYFPITISPNQWHHIAIQAKGKQTTTIVNDLAKTLQRGITIEHDLSKFWRPKDFTLGGFGEKIESPHLGNFFWGSFTGYIDEVRLSTVARYDITQRNFTPQSRFKPDANTVALWHFDEPGGTRRFSDSSDNGYRLVGEGGAKTGISFAVEAKGKLTTTWAALKH